MNYGVGVCVPIVYVTRPMYLTHSQYQAEMITLHWHAVIALIFDAPDLLLRKLVVIA